MTATIHLKPRKQESIRRFHPWIFSGAIAETEGQPAEGDLVRVVDAENRFLAAGHFAEESIAVRILSFREDEVVDIDFFRQRLTSAWQLRRSLGLVCETNNCFRLINGEGDSLPGLIIDVYAGIAVLQAHSAGMYNCRKQIAGLLPEISEGQIHAVYDKSANTLPGNSRTEVSDGFLIGSKSETPVEALENGMKIYPDLYRGQKTGFFIDQRENRTLLAHYARGRSVLNLFCYTGGFSLAALRGNAEQVLSVDSSAKAIELCKEHVAQNFPCNIGHKALSADAFHTLEECRGGVYDLIVLDPPAFAKHRHSLPNALNGYRKLNAEALRKIAPGGLLFTFSCSQAVSREDFRLSLFTAATMAGRSVRILHQLTQPADHPVNIYHPEGEYLKGFVLYVE